jgi:hypothetical protein
VAVQVTLRVTIVHRPSRRRASVIYRFFTLPSSLFPDESDLPSSILSHIVLNPWAIFRGKKGFPFHFVILFYRLINNFRILNQKANRHAVCNGLIWDKDYQLRKGKGDSLKDFIIL